MRAHRDRQKVLPCLPDRKQTPISIQMTQCQTSQPDPTAFSGKEYTGCAQTRIRSECGQGPEVKQKHRQKGSASLLLLEMGCGSPGKVGLGSQSPRNCTS